MKSIAFVCPSLSLGGAERHLVRYAKGLHLRGYNVSIFVLGSGAALAGELPAGVEVTFLNTRFGDVRGLIALRKLLTRKKPDTVFGWSSLASFLACMAAPKSSKLIVCELNYPPLAYRARGRAVNLVWRTLTLLYKRADVVTANSDLALQVLTRWVGPTPRYMRIYNPIEFDEIERLSQDTGIDVPYAGQVRIVAVGRLDNQHKGFDILVAALSQIASRPDWSCVIVGGGPDRQKLEAQITSAGLTGRISMTGPQANPFPFMRAADIFVLPSRREGFPNVLLEAMTLGRAVIAADCLAGPREITDNGRVGVLFPVDDADGLGSEIVRLLDRPALREEMGELAGKRVKTAWSESAVFKRLAEVIECPRRS